MLDGKAYRAHFPDDPAYELPPGVPRPLNSAALMEALAALEAEFRAILRQRPPEERASQRLTSVHSRVRWNPGAAVRDAGSPLSRGRTDFVVPDRETARRAAAMAACEPMA